MCFNRRVDKPLAEKLNAMFVELVFAPGYDEDALEVLQSKENVRILEDSERRTPSVTEQDLKRVRGGMLIQDRDLGAGDAARRCRWSPSASRREAEWGEMLFAWRVCKHVRSNAIVLVARPRHGGHRRRADEPCRLGADRRREGGRRARSRWTARSWPPTRSSRSPTAPRWRSTPACGTIIQPGGSQRDLEVVDACDAAGVAMVFTSRRHFRH